MMHVLACKHVAYGLPYLACTTQLMPSLPKSVTVSSGNLSRTSLTKSGRKEMGTMALSLNRAADPKECETETFGTDLVWQYLDRIS